LWRKSSGADLGVWGSIMSSPSGVWGGATTTSDFSYMQIKSELISGHRRTSILLQRWASGH